MIQKTVKIGSETVELKFSNSAVRKIDRELGYSLIHVLEKIKIHGTMAPLSLDCLSTIIWGGMLHSHPGQDIDTVAERIPLKMDEYVTVAVEVINIISEIYGADDVNIDVRDPGKGISQS